MKRRFKAFSSLAAAMLLLCAFTLPGGAAALQKDKAANYICTRTDGYTVKQSVSPQNYQAMQSSLARQGMTKREMNRQILAETEFLKDSDPAFEAILDAMEGGASLEVTTQYIKETPSGQKIQMNKVAFERAVMEETSKQSRQLRAPSEDHGGTEEPPSSYNGYVKMAILYVHTVKGTKHLYGAFGTLEWVTMPFTRMTDAMSFYSNALTWEDKNSNQYNNYMLFWTADYKETDAAGYVNYGQEYTETNARKAEKFPSGFYFSFRLPVNFSYMEYTKTYTRFQITIAGSGELSNNNINTFELFLQYAHKRLGLSSDVSFSWSVGNKYPGVTFSIFPNVGNTYYRLSKKVV